MGGPRPYLCAHTTKPRGPAPAAGVRGEGTHKKSLRHTTTQSDTTATAVRVLTSPACTSMARAPPRYLFLDFGLALYLAQHSP